MNIQELQDLFVCPLQINGYFFLFPWRISHKQERGKGYIETNVDVDKLTKRMDVLSLCLYFSLFRHKLLETEQIIFWFKIQSASA